MQIEYYNNNNIYLVSEWVTPLLEGFGCRQDDSPPAGFGNALVTD